MAQESLASSSKDIVVRNVTEEVLGKVKALQHKKELVIPPNYSPENALKEAFLILQNTKNRDKVPVLTSCTKGSISLALLDMVIQGLNPLKKQCYFIAYGKELSLHRSYFGTISALKMVNPEVRNVVGQVIYEGDEFEYEIDLNPASPNLGQKIIKKHVQKFGNINKSNIVGAYAIIIGNGCALGADVMTFSEIKQSWRQSRQSPIMADGKINPDSVHGKFTQDMALKTVLSRACKIPMNTSNDESIMIDSFMRTTDNENAPDEDDGVFVGDSEVVVEEEVPMIEKPEETPEASAADIFANGGL